MPTAGQCCIMLAIGPAGWLYIQPGQVPITGRLRCLRLRTPVRGGRRMRRSLKFAGRRTAVALAAAAAVTCTGLTAAGPAVAVGRGDWPAFLGGPPHFSASADPAITPANAPVLAQKWHFNIPFVSSPVVADGSV